jgi:hypothetical protein
LPDKGGSLVAIEAKSGRYPADQYSRCTGEELKKRIKDRIIDGFIQLSNRLREFQEGCYPVNEMAFDQFNSVYPVVCTLTPMHLGPKYWKIIKSKIKDKSLFGYSQKIKPPRLMSIAEIESLFKLKMLPWRTLDGWARSDMKDCSFDEYRESNLSGSPRNRHWEENIKKDMVSALAALLGFSSTDQ